LEVAELIAAEMRLASSAAIFIDCNAVSPQTMGEVAQAFDNTDARVLAAALSAGRRKTTSQARTSMSAAAQNRWCRFL
jgi:3-hydroxyisobutyrate dehydrogenase-like beta-hydroxyacid dehydrogenase